MSKRNRKLIAPIIITAVLIAYLAVYVFVCATLQFPLWGKIVGIVAPLVLMGVSVSVLVERIKEVRSGEEDDLSQY